MAGDGSSRLTAICFLASFLWLAFSLDRHSLLDKPRLSAFLLLLISGALSFATSYFSDRLPGADGRFDSEAILKVSRPSLPKRPRRFYVPCIIILIVVRLEILYRVVFSFQCTVQGVEAFIPLLLAAYQFGFSRNTRHVSDEPEDMWGSAWDDFTAWLNFTQLGLLLSTLFISYGVFLIADFAPRSSYFCSTLIDHTSWVVLLQWAGVFADATILILLWRVLSWSRTTKSRLRTLSGILTASSVAPGLLWLMVSVFRRQTIISSQTFRGLDSLYIFDVLGSGVVCAALLVSFTLWICESNPLTPASVATFICGMSMTVQQILAVGKYVQPTTMEPLVAISVISVGFVIFTYAHSLRSIVYIPRVLIALLLLCSIIAATIFSFLRNKPMDRHPANEFVYRNRVEADRWLRHATVSGSLKLAVQEYQERHSGRNPPLGFEKWYEFAVQRESVVIDRYDQIEKDIIPFWGMSPLKIRDGLEVVKALPDVGIIKIVEGKAYHNQPADPSHKMMLDEAVSLISSFSQYLPEMSMAINLKERPRILVPWDDIHRLTNQATRRKFPLLPRSLSKRGTNLDGSSELVNDGGNAFKAAPKSTARPYVSPKVFQHLQSLACPPGSKARSGINWNVRDLCTSCTAPHSTGQFLRDWEQSLNPCHQPDIFHLHDFHTLPHRSELYQDLLPLFSRSKTDSFNDILMPLIRPNSNQEPDSKSFDQKVEILFWQDKPSTQQQTHQSLHGGQRHRLVHLANNVTAFDKGSMLFEIASGDMNNDDRDKKFAYEQVGIREANSPLPIVVSFTDPEKCEDLTCLVLRDEFGFQPRAETFDHRYVMLLDTEDGPPPDLLHTLRSNSVPFLSSIFREWYTDRLMPWVHFVPIDLRYHGLQSTLAYFVGLRGRGDLNGRNQLMEPKTEDARWIAEQGRKWADKAIRREDMEVYMFRLLLEWGRVVNDDRDNMGFVFKEET